MSRAGIGLASIRVGKDGIFVTVAHRTQVGWVERPRGRLELATGPSGEPGSKDERARSLIASRLDRLTFGHGGDIAPVGGGVSELRIHYGPGYRVHFRQHGQTLVIRPCDGDNGSQAGDIRTARRLAEEWTDDHGNETDAV